MWFLIIKKSKFPHLRCFPLEMKKAVKEKCSFNLRVNNNNNFQKNIFLTIIYIMKMLNEKLSKFLIIIISFFLVLGKNRWLLNWKLKKKNFCTLLSPFSSLSLSIVGLKFYIICIYFFHCFCHVCYIRTRVYL